MTHRVPFSLLLLVQAVIVMSMSGSAMSQKKTGDQVTEDAMTNEVEIDILQLEEVAVKAAVLQVSQSVVQIETIGGTADDAGVSTGTVVSADGLVLTAAYNLRHNPSSIFIRATTASSQKPERYVAELLATDHSRNLCLLKAKLPDDLKLPSVVAASESSLRVGSTTIAVGKVHDASVASISVGILSAIDRISAKAVQTDAKISRTNYGGPLINFAGETIGVLVPLSPDDDSVEAGADWYDSGIGFAVPLESYFESIAQMAEGQDLSQGLLGITLTSEDIYADVPEIELCSPNSPAAESGLLPGDTIVAVDGVTVISQAQMKQVTGPKYAGDKITITVRRSEQEKSFTATLTDKIEPFVELAIGIVPARMKKKLALIAQVLPGSPAADLPLKSGDIISAVNAKEVKTWDDFQSEINKLEADAKIEIVVRNETQDNGSAAETKTIALAPLSASLPPMIDAADDINGELNKAGDMATESWELIEVAIKVAGSANRCTAFIPRRNLTDGGKDDSQRPLLVWVAQPGNPDMEKLRAAVEPVVTQRGLVVVVPQSLNPQGWSPEESEFIVKAIGKLKKRVAIDERRIAIGGSLTAAKMSSLTAFLNRETFRGLIMLNSLFPGRIPKIETRPDQRLMIMIITNHKFAKIDQLKKMKKVIEKKKFPIYHHRSTNETFAEMLPEISRWINALDRH